MYICMYMYTSVLFGLIRCGESEHIVLHIDLQKKVMGMQGSQVFI